MRHGFLSLIAATGMVGLMAIAANAGGLTPLSDSSLATVSAKGIYINQSSSINLSGTAGSHATGIVIANASGSAVNDQVNLNAQLRVRHFWLRQNNNGTALNDIQVSLAPTAFGYGSSSSGSGSGYHHHNHSFYRSSYHYFNYGSSKTSKSSVKLSGNAQEGATGFVIANMASSAVNNQLNVNVQRSVNHFSLAQNNYGLAVNNRSVYTAGF